MKPPTPERIYIHKDHITYTQYHALDDDKHTIVALQMLGPEQSVKAAWAHLVTNGKQSAYIDKTTVLLDGSKMHVMMKTPLIGCGWLEMWLIHKQAMPDYVSPGNANYFYVFHIENGSYTPKERLARLQPPFINMLNRVIGTPILPQWANYLWNEAYEAGGLDPLTITLNTFAYRFKTSPEKWQAIISKGLQVGQISF